jgi:hypothetical protein
MEESPVHPANSTIKIKKIQKILNINEKYKERIV